MYKKNIKKKHKILVFFLEKNLTKNIATQARPMLSNDMAPENGLSCSGWHSV